MSKKFNLLRFTGCKTFATCPARKQPYWYTHDSRCILTRSPYFTRLCKTFVGIDWASSHMIALSKTFRFLLKSIHQRRVEYWRLLPSNDLMHCERQKRERRNSTVSSWKSKYKVNAPEHQQQGYLRSQLWNFSVSKHQKQSPMAWDIIEPDQIAWPQGELHDDEPHEKWVNSEKRRDKMLSPSAKKRQKEWKNKQDESVYLTALLTKHAPKEKWKSQEDDRLECWKGHSSGFQLFWSRYLIITNIMCSAQQPLWDKSISTESLLK